MSIIRKLDPRRLLGNPAAYDLHSRVAANDARKKSFAERFLAVENRARVLDIGCGTAPLLSYMGDVAYVGFDLSLDYVEQARRTHAGRNAQFFHRPLTLDVAKELEPFDFAMALGVTHHLDDMEARTLFAVAHASLKPGGRLVTCDGAFVRGQHPLAWMLLKLDRGRHVRSPQDYAALAGTSFAEVEVSVHHDLNAYPYTHCVMVCHRAA